jgi:hypothetical protein
VKVEAVSTTLILALLHLAVQGQKVPETHYQPGVVGPKEVCGITANGPHEFEAKVRRLPGAEYLGGSNEYHASACPAK